MHATDIATAWKPTYYTQQKSLWARFAKWLFSVLSVSALVTHGLNDCGHVWTLLIIASIRACHNPWGTIQPPESEKCLAGTLCFVGWTNDALPQLLMGWSLVRHSLRGVFGQYSRAKALPITTLYCKCQCECLHGPQQTNLRMKQQGCQEQPWFRQP